MKLNSNSIKLKTKNMNKNKSFILAAVLVAIFSIVFVSAVPTVNISSPITWGNYSGTWNVSMFSNVVNATGPYNVTLYCNSSGGAVDSRTGADIIVVSTLSNRTADGQSFESSAVSIAAYTDKLIIYNCSAYADNQTHQSWSVAVKNITIDNTSPSCTLSVANARIPSQSTVNPTWSVTDALSLLNNAENITGPTGFTTLTYSTTSSTFTQMLGLPGTYTINVLGTDTAGNICTAQQQVVVYPMGGSAVIPSELLGEKKNYAGILLVIAGLIAIIYFVSKK